LSAGSMKNGPGAGYRWNKKRRSLRLKKREWQQKGF